jgi:LysR family transcriptional activator of nhaA
MEWLNYNHLFYFWVVAREGSIARACDELLLTQPTISAQIRLLENALGEKLFARAGRNLVLTEVGRVVFRSADEIFTLGRELTDTLKGRSPGRPVRFVVGVADVLPKLIAYRLLEPALKMAEPVRVVCREDKSERLLAALAVHELDLVPPAVIAERVTVCLSC